MTTREWRRYRASEAAKYLDRVRGMAMRIKSLNFAIDDIYQAAGGVRGIDYSREHVDGSTMPDAMLSALANLEDLLAELEAKQSVYSRELSGVIRALDKMSDDQSAAIIEMHYVAGKTWAACAEAFHYSKTGMMSARQRALDGFYDVMPKSQAIEIPSAI